MGREICKTSCFTFPFQLIPSNSRIVLYGAGQFGKAYYLQNMRCGFCEIVSWVDKDYDKKIYGKQIMPPVALLGMDYDFILVAVSAESIADRIKEELQGMGIIPDKILWNPPLFPMKVNELKTYAQWEQFFMKTDRLIIGGQDEVTMACLGFFMKHSAWRKITKILIREPMKGLKDITGIEVQNLDEFQHNSYPILLAMNDRFHMSWLMELYDRGCKDIYLLKNDCYRQLYESARDRIEQWKRKSLFLKGGVL